MTEQICKCGRPTRDAAFVCDGCLNDLTNDLNEAPGLDEELEVTVTRQRGAAIAGGSANSGESALPWHDKASEVQRELHATLSTWVRLCHESGVRHQSRTDDLPSDRIAGMARWLLWRVDGLAFHEAGYEAVRDISRATERARNIVFFKPQPRMYLGPCGAAHYDGPCPGDVYANSGQQYGYCDLCGDPHPVDVRRSDMERKLDDKLVTAAEIAHLATYLGLQADRERVRNLVNQWHKREKVTARGHDAKGDPRFRYGEVRLMLASLETRETRETA